jgi:RNA polymerase sigma-70 factor, ECF subfamily
MKEVTVETIKRAVEGDKRSFKDIYDITADYIYTIVYKVVGNKEDAEEVTQDVFVKIHGNLGKFNFKSTFKTWIYRIAVNKAIDRYRKRKRRKEVNVDFGDDLIAQKYGSSHDAGFDEEESSDLLRTMLMELPVEQRACIALRGMKGLSYEEISSVLKVNINTVRSRIKRAREKLFTIYKKEIER